MGDTALLCPGQGSQTPGMGEALYEAWPSFRAAFDRLDAATDEDLAALVFDGTDDRLRRTRYTQPAVFAVGTAAAAALDERFGITGDVVAGHSLGHFTALAAAGGLEPTAGVQLVATRGRLMDRAGREYGETSMVAVLLVEPSVVREAAASEPDVAVAVYNGPRQTVVSGDAAGVERVIEQITADHRARTTELDVSTAFHSPVMAPIVDEFADAFAETPVTPPAVPVVSDVTGEAYTDADTPRRELVEQLTSPVRWSEVVETLAARGVDRWVELPPAGTLARLVERMDVAGEVIQVDDPAAAQEVFGDE